MSTSSYHTGQVVALTPSVFVTSKADMLRMLGCFDEISYWGHSTRLFTRVSRGDSAAQRLLELVKNAEQDRYASEKVYQLRWEQIQRELSLLAAHSSRAYRRAGKPFRLDVERSVQASRLRGGPVDMRDLQHPSSHWKRKSRGVL